MTDDERLLEIATRLMAGMLANPQVTLSAKNNGKSVEECICDGAFDFAEYLIAQSRERTGAERGQDVSDRLLGYSIAALENCRRRCDEAGCSYDNCVWDEMKAEAEAVQRARAAGKGEG